MKVDKVEGKKEIQVRKYGENELKGELNFYLADKMIRDLFLLDEISLEEYRKIRRENIKKFKPILSELLL
ncbi:SHOCT domain-containing protein [Facklamia sp. P12950]|uniref:SHOCT domain-containing protein n=1 Tax=Facklamia sp. P12950 TaxID=3421951 RepID=UPI003D1716FF